ncbi:MAG: hypothetical protein HOM07_09955 [Rhodospirillaceae bacterium]|nr:hypothetical protein [Rhodospirillaceae bacterium]
MTIAVIAVATVVIYWSRWSIGNAWRRALETWLRPDIRRRRLAFIQKYKFSPDLHQAFRRAHPQIGEEPHAAIFWALKDYFALLALNGREGDAIAMPSRIVAEAWELFSADGNAYDDFCQNAFGAHVPPEAAADANGDAGIVRTWYLLCARLRLDPARPTRLPRMFALDRRLNIENGVYYALSAHDLQSMEQANLAGAVYLLTELGTPLWSDPGALMWTQSHAADLAGMASSGGGYPSEMAPVEGGFAGGGDGFMADSGGGMDFGGDAAGDGGG